MIVLKIEEEKRKELTEKGIVICTYIRADNNKEIDAISIEYKNEYPTFVEVKVKDSEFYI